MKKRFFLWMLLLLGLLSAAAETDQIYFYENFCESCDPVQEFAETFERLTGQAASKDSFESWNTIRSAGMARFEEFCEENDLSVDERRLPMLVWNGKIYAGSEALEYDLPKDCLSEPGATDSVVWLISCGECPDCASAQALAAALSQTWTVTRGTYAFESALRVEIKKPQDADVQEHLEAMGLQDALNAAPCVLLGDRAYCGLEEIEENLERAIRVGAAVGGLRAAQE